MDLTVKTDFLDSKEMSYDISSSIHVSMQDELLTDSNTPIKLPQQKANIPISSSLKCLNTICLYNACWFSNVIKHKADCFTMGINHLPGHVINAMHASHDVFNYYSWTKIYG